MSNQNINPRTGRPYSETPGKNPFAPIDEEVQFQLVPENDWSAVDAATMGMSTPDILKLQQGLSVEVDMDKVKPATGTNTGTGDREAPAPKPEAKPEPVSRTAADVVDGFGNDFGSMKSSRLSDALRGAQVGIIQKRMDAGENFGFKSTVTTPQTTSDPAKPEDGASAVPDTEDQSRAVEIPKIDPQEFLQGALVNLPAGMRGDDAAEESIAEYYSTRTHKDVFDEATQTWKKVPINK